MYKYKIRRQDSHLISQVTNNNTPALVAQALSGDDQRQIHKYPNTQTHKYTNTQIHKYTYTQIHKYTNTASDKNANKHNMCYIFEKVMIQGHQK